MNDAITPPNLATDEPELPKLPLPTAHLQPTIRDTTVIGFCSAYGDPDEGGQCYLTINCVGVDVMVHLDIEQAEQLVKALQEHIDMERELEL